MNFGSSGVKWVRPHDLGGGALFGSGGVIWDSSDQMVELKSNLTNFHACNIMSKQVTLGEQFKMQTFEALALQVPGGHFLIF